jgi:hypothetical protein
LQQAHLSLSCQNNHAPLIAAVFQFFKEAAISRAENLGLGAVIENGPV